MYPSTRSTLRAAALLPLLCLALILTGCGLNLASNPSDPSGPSAASTGTTIRGNVHGGQQPVAGAHIYLFAANIGNAYAGSGISASSGNASVSLLSSASTGHSDAIGAYVLSGADGSFSLAGDYTCAPNQQVYLYALGGDPGAGANPSAAFLAVVGNCPAAGTFASTVPFIWINEVSTVAAAFAMSGYATDATHVSALNLTSAKTGLANAFANASNLAGISTGAALSLTPAGNGIVPASTINTLANILAACVNTSSTTTGSTVTPSTACSILLATATSDSTSTGTHPSDTASAAINIAHFPAANVATLYNLVPTSAAFYPALVLQPADLTLSIAYTGGGVASANHLAIDASGNVWTSNDTNIAELSPLGAALSPSAGFTHAALTSASFLSVDASGNVWVNNVNDASLVEFSNTGSFTRSVALPNNAFHFAFDGSGNIWAPNYADTTYEVSKLSSTGASIGNYTGGSIQNPAGIAISPAGNVWVSNSGAVSGLSEFNNSGAGTGPFNVAGIRASLYLAVDSSNNVWTMNNSGNVSAITSSGTPLIGSPFTPFTNASQIGLVIDGQNHVFGLNSAINFQDFSLTENLFALNQNGSSLTGLSSLTAPAGATDLAIDSSGNLWISTPTGLVQILGVATPVMTPLAASVQNSCLGQRPCFPL